MGVQNTPTTAHLTIKESLFQKFDFLFKREVYLLKHLYQLIFNQGEILLHFAKMPTFYLSVQHVCFYEMRKKFSDETSVFNPSPSSLPVSFMRGVTYPFVRENGYICNRKRCSTTVSTALWPFSICSLPVLFQRSADNSTVLPWVVFRCSTGISLELNRCYIGVPLVFYHCMPSFSPVSSWYSTYAPPLHLYSTCDPLTLSLVSGDAPPAL